VQRELQRLAEAGIITRVVRGRTAFYQANRDCPIFRELHGLLIKTAGVADVLADALLALKDRIDVAFIYGSAAKASLRAESDKAGQVVIKGETLGTVGSTGRSTGPHLFFAVRWHNARVDPRFLLEAPAKIPSVNEASTQAERQ